MKIPNPGELPPISLRRRERIRQVQDLTDSGWSQEEIAQLFDMTVRMVRYDLADGKLFDIALSKAVDQGEVLGREIRSYERALKSEWRKYQTATNPFVQVCHMKNIIALKEKYVKFLQSAGLLDKAAEKVDLSLEKVSLADFTKEELEVIASAGLKLARSEEDGEGPEED